ncbi:MAG: PKD domain-containing protein, partial [Cytophagales bacterium]|nr:PKD domain-containing protein [Cytophagales bacterium]
LLSDTSLCAGNAVSIRSFGNTIKSYLWNGLITTSSFQIITTGGYTLKTINQNNCENNTTFNVTISGIAPTVFFTSSVVSDTVCVGSSVRFSNGSTFPSGVNSLGYRWDFGNGISNGSVWTPQTTTYTASGLYFVTLSVAGANGCSNTFSRKMTVLNNPVSIFTSSSAPYCQGDTLRFFNAGQANNPGIPLSTYLWNFGNPSNLANTSTLPNPTFVYTNTGTYTVTFQVGNTYGCKNSASRSFQILGSPKVNFTSTRGCFGTPISFSDSTVNAPNTTISTRLWTFGNGSSSTAPAATITYSSLGDYSVTLLATNNVGCSSSIKKIISIKDSPVPAIAYGPACDKSYIQFLDKSVMIGDSIIYWSWQFGATQSSLLQNPKVILGDTGTYNVSLTVGTKTCTTAIARPERVKVNLRPVASFAATPAFGSPPLTVTLTSSLTGISRWQWNFGIQTVTSALPPPITTVYPDSGRYRIRLNTYLANGCVDSTERIVLVSRPIIDLSVSSLGVTSINGNQQLSVLLTNAG